MYAVIRRYTFDPDSAGEIERHMRQGLAPLLRRTPGFAVFYWLDGGDGSGASLDVWEDAAAAANAVQLTSEYLSLHLTAGEAPMMSAGEVKIHLTSGL